MQFGTIFIDALTKTWGLIWGFFPAFILAVLVLIIGGLLAFFLKRGVIWVFEQVQINKGAERIGLKEILERSGKYNLPAFFGWIVQWFIVIVAFVVALELMGLGGVTAFFKDIGGYILHVATAVLILLVGVVIANFLSSLIRGSVRVGRLVSANFLANAAWLAIFVFTVLIALRELQVPAQVINYLVIGAIAALTLAAGIALGTGQESARKWFGKTLRDIIE